MFCNGIKGGDKMRHNVQRIVVLTTCIAFSMFLSPKIFAQGYVYVGGGMSAGSVDLITQDNNETLTFGGATGPGDAAVAYSNGSDYDWHGDILMSSSGIFSIADGKTLRLLGNSIAGGTGVVFVKDGLGKIDASTSSSGFTGSLTIREGSFAASSNFGSEILTIGNNAVFDIENSSQSYEQIQGSGKILIDSSGSLTVGSNTQSSTFSGIIDGNGSFTKTGSSAVTMVGDTTFSGSVDVNQGTLTLYSNIYFMGLNVAGGATFNNNNNTQGTHGLTGSGTILLGDDQSRMIISNNTNDQFDGKFVGSGTISKTAPGDLTLTAVDSSFSGSFDVVSGVLIVTSSNAGNKKLSVASGGTFDMSNTTQNYQQIEGGGEILIGSGSLTIGSDTNASLFSGEIFDSSGYGTLTKTGAASFTLGDGGEIAVGHFNVNQGEFVMQGNSSLSVWDGVSAYVPGMTIASGASMRLSPTASGSPIISETLINVQGKLVLEMRDYPLIATFDHAAPAGNPDNVVFEGISYLAPSETRTISFTDISSPELQTGLFLWNSSFNKPLIHTQLNSAGGSDYDMSINAVSLSDFASSAGGFTQNQLSQIADMETERLDSGIGGDRRTIFEGLFNSSDAYSILSSLTTVTDKTNEVADTIASFNIGHVSLLSDIAFNTSGNWVGKSFQTGGQSPNTTNTTYRGQSSNAVGNKPIFYFQPYYRSVKTDTRAIGEGYGIAKTGFLAGATIDTDSTSSVGFLFGYSNPELYQNDRNVNMNDLHVGLMTVKSLPRNFDLGLLFSMGWQRGNSFRDVWGPNANNSDILRYRFRGNMSGHTFNATANLGKRIEIGKHFILKPTVGVDYEGTQLSPFSETMNDTIVNTSSLYDNLMARRSYDASSFDRVLFKVGMAGSYSGSKGGISGKVLYGTQLGGSDIVTIDAKILDGIFAGDSRNYSSLPIGRDFIYLDGGVHRYINEKKTALLYASYNTTLYSFTTEKTVSLGFQWMN